MAAVATFRGGPLDGAALESWPKGAVLKANGTEAHIPQPEAVLIYQPIDADMWEGGAVPAWTFLRAEPVYRRR